MTSLIEVDWFSSQWTWFFSANTSMEKNLFCCYPPWQVSGLIWWYFFLEVSLLFSWSWWSQAFLSLIVVWPACSFWESFCFIWLGKRNQYTFFSSLGVVSSGCHLIEECGYSLVDFFCFLFYQFRLYLITLLASIAFHSVNGFPNFSISMFSSSLYPDPSVTAAPPTSPCLDGFFLYENACYTVDNQPRTWEQGKGECQKAIGGNLVSIHSLYENAAVQVFLSKAASTAWIGFSRDDMVSKTKTHRSLTRN